MVSQYISHAMEKSSWIRKMFEAGNEMKRIHGAENVFDLSLGNPIVEPPDAFFEILEKLATDRNSGKHRYMSNA
ncbi:MAG: pyridoxal phosphate-dependent aminotransferase, partial [bacterium]|nr:pyridoxal phosphate-dependent aminotransferase [bacterium]